MSLLIQLRQKSISCLSPEELEGPIKLLQDGGFLLSCDEFLISNKRLGLDVIRLGDKAKN